MNEKIPRRLSACKMGGEPFQPGSEYLSVLNATGQGWERSDYCVICWEKIKKDIKGHFWRGKIPLKKDKKLSPDEKALGLFIKLDDPKLLSVLALYLQRRGQIMKRGEEKEFHYYEVPETGEMISVPKMILSPEESKDAGETLIHLLDDVSPS